MKKLLLFSVICALSVGCSSKQTASTTPSFTLAFSEYPSWVTFLVASENGYINGEAGKLGPIEEKYNVDIVLKEADYDTCITLYGNAQVDAACLTNMDTLAPCLGRNSVGILPTSTSVGGDAVIVANNINTIEDLKGKKTYGLEKSVSQYCFERNLELQGQNPKDYPFANMDPAAAAQAFQTNQPNIESIIVWNPFVLQTLRTRTDSKTLFTSANIPEEIIDMVVVGKDSLAKEGGDRFANALVETYYSVNQDLINAETKDKTLVALGAKFSSLGLEDMKLVCEQTRFYATADQAITLFNGDKFRKETMPSVVSFCVSHGIVDAKPVVGFDDSNAQFNITTKYLLSALNPQPIH